MEAKDEELDILTFGNKKKISFGGALSYPRRPLHASAAAEKRRSPSDDSNSSSYDSGDGETPRRRRRRKRSHKSAVGGRSGSLASRLIHNQAVIIEDDRDDEDYDSDGFTSPVKRSKGSRDVLLLDSPHSSSPSPQPSPPPPGCYRDLNTPTDSKSRRVLDKANNVLNQLRYANTSDSFYSPVPDYTIDLNSTDPTLSANKPSFRLRIRCRGKIHKYNVYKTDPLSHACTLLLSELNVDSTHQVLLSHKTSTIKQTESPDSLKLTTADILDAVIMTEEMAAADTSTTSLNNSQGGEENITITLRSSNKRTTYSLPKSQPLQKAMTAFASELGVSISKLKFSFDGDPVDPTKTAEDLDLENDDCIDVGVTA